MKLVVAIVRPEKLPDVLESLFRADVRGLTINRVQGHGGETGVRSVQCVEFEATRKSSLQDALATVEKYERATGFDSLDRSHRSLLQILFPEITEQLGLGD